MTHANIYTQGLDRTAANYSTLSPLSFIERTAFVYPDRAATIYNGQMQDWRTTYERCRRLASALASHGVGVGDTVAVMLPNVPAMFEVHFGVPMCGAVLNTLNTRLDSEAIAFMLKHGEASILIADREFSPIIRKALSIIKNPLPLVIEVEDVTAPDNGQIGDICYEDFLASGDPDYDWKLPIDEWDAIALNYTSGTTGDPKGVVTHHRGAYLNAANNVIAWTLPNHPVYLWTLPMFHCNGWCFPWTMALVAGVSVCLRRIDPVLIWSLIQEQKVTHLCGAPIIYSLLINTPADKRSGIQHRLKGLIAGAAPPASVIVGCEEAGISLTHVYGLTEVYGPAAVCAKQDSWSQKPITEQALLNARQGVAYPLQQAINVLDPLTMLPVPADGETIGEVCFKGNIVMKGYLKNNNATEEAFRGGWFHTGDLGVIHADGYVQIKDRSKDIIISGGENISSIEVEDILHRHPAVLSAAVVALSDPKWGEVPCAFVELKPNFEVLESDLIMFCRSQIAHFKIPKHIVFGELPKTSTGKIQKFQLREKAKLIYLN